MPDPHAATQRAAERTGDQLKQLFDRLGGLEHPRGRVLSAYRQARRAMRGAVGDPVEAQMVLEELRRALDEIMSDSLAAALESGVAQGRKELAAYDVPVVEPGDLARLGVDMGAGWRSVSEGQINAVYAMIVTGTADEAMILGGEDRLGMLTPAPVANEGTRWLGMAAFLANKRVTDNSLIQTGRKDEFRRQAIAALDERTTDCCLRVHGQTTTIDGDFTLTGTPRFAPKLHGPPFHWYCRTAVALVRVEDTDDKLTRQMRGAAGAEIKAREEAQRHIDDLKKQLADMGQAPDVRIRKEDTPQIKNLRNRLREWRNKARQEIHPAHARSRR